MFDRIFGGTRPTIEEMAAGAFSGLRASRQDIQNRLFSFGRLKPEPMTMPAMRQVEQSVIQLRRINRESRREFERLKKQKTHATAELRKFQMRHGVVRPAQMPDPFTTGLIAQFCILIEGLLTAALMIGDGKMDIATGLIYGLSVAFINVVTGLMAGFLPARYVAYKLDAPAAKPRDALIRGFAWFGLAAFIFAMCVLHFAAARVRATGSHNGIFDFSEVGIAATFGDYYAIAILVVGALGSILAVYKGYNGISDPVPGYSETQREAEGRIDAVAEELRGNRLQQIHNSYTSAVQAYESQTREQAQQIIDRDARYEEAHKAVVAHNNRVGNEKDRLRVIAAEECAANEFVDQKPSEKPPLNLEAFDQLIIAEFDLPDAEPRPELGHGDADNGALFQLQEEHDKAVSAVLSAHAAFVAHTPKFDLNLDED